MTGGVAVRFFYRLTVIAVVCVTVSCATASARPIHIVAFGDSATYGWLVARKDAYPAQLQTLLRKKGYDVTVANAGVPGDTTKGALRRFDRAVGPDTDIAIVEFGTNDLRLHVSQTRMRANLSEVVRTLRKRGIEILLIGLGSLKLDDVARAQGVAYAQWNLPPGKFRARDHAHYNAQGYAIVVGRMLPQVELLLKRVENRSPR
jgi:acyl-CoA thioesterase I